MPSQVLEKFLQENELQEPKNIKKMFRKSPNSDAWVTIFKNVDFS